MIIKILKAITQPIKTLKIIYSNLVSRYKVNLARSFGNNISVLTGKERKIFLTEFLDNQNYKEEKISDFIALTREGLLDSFKDKYKNEHYKFLIFIPSAISSPAGYSIFHDLSSGLRFSGIETETFSDSESFKRSLKSFQPNIIIGIAHDIFMKNIDWSEVSNYKMKNKLIFGLQLPYDALCKGSVDLDGLKNKADFFYSFHCLESIHNDNAFKCVLDEGFDIFSYEFSANPLYHYPIDLKKRIDYVYLSSINMDKMERHAKFLKPIIEINRNGFINGPGWTNMNNFIPLERNNWIYSSAKLGLNIHLEEQIQRPNEINQRSYVLAACGVPQLTDTPKLLNYRIPSKFLFTASDPAEFKSQFEIALNDEILREEKRINACLHVYEQHTVFHRISDLVDYLKNFQIY